MGTSTRNKGQSGHTPLVPTWLEGEEDIGSQQETQQIPPDGDANRFIGPIRSFTEYVNGGGRNGSAMKSAVSNYVRRSLGGTENATKRLGSARITAGRLYSVINAIGFGGGIDYLANELSIDNLNGLPADLFFLRIADFIVPDGGPNDEGIARSAYFEAIADNPKLSGIPIENISSEDRDEVLQNFMGKVIEEHIMNDIANKVIQLPNDMKQIAHIEKQVKQLIKNSVSDAFAGYHSDTNKLRSHDAKKITDQIYRKIYNILGSEE